jgi:hypothetical protein
MSPLLRLPPCLALTTLVGFALAAPSEHLGKRSITDGSQVSGKTYDFVIAGGGLGGSVLASRLSEDSTKTGALIALPLGFTSQCFTVLLIEAGYNQEGNIDVYSECRLYESAFHS